MQVLSARRGRLDTRPLCFKNRRSNLRDHGVCNYRIRGGKTTVGCERLLTFHQTKTYKSSVAELVKTEFASLPPLKNPDIMDLADDLAQLSYLHEPAVFRGVKSRFQQKYIYTYSGIVLIAMNPFEKLDLYSTDIMREYAGKRRDELEPHVFGIAEEAYRAMLNGTNQSIIVSGESGAGKTQSTKYIMRYFATVDALSKIDETEALMRPDVVDNVLQGGQSDIERAVLATNPILESFGNAKTIRNDNSSRFGKFIELFFSKPETGSVRITGAKIRTYLLERSRLIFQPSEERNYHIFYQLCAAIPVAEKQELGLDTWQSFFYLNQGKAGVVSTINDIADFADTQRAFSTVGVPVSKQWQIFRLCAALLHIGNIQILAQGEGGSTIADTDPALIKAVELLEIDQASFVKWTTKRQITTRGEKFVKELTKEQATVLRDSTAKFIYTKLFDWLVDTVNASLKRDLKDAEQFIGVLDIYGFEHFKVNSFEQFCINYANEKLQQEFNAHVFRLEQELYMREKIVWKMIAFNDNQACIDLIENKLGILDLLDEETRVPSGSDTSFLSKLNSRFDVRPPTPVSKFYEKPRIGQKSFIVKHYAVNVEYTVDGFLEKNRDTVALEQYEVLSKSGSSLLREVIKLDDDEPLAHAQAAAAAGSGGGLPRKMTMSKKPTLGSMFKTSLIQLMETMRVTESHYIRCIKPNILKRPFGFEAQMVLAQLRACGVLETIKISCAGYPNKMTHEQFANRYYLLVRSIHWNLPPRELAEKIVTAVISDVDKYQFGITQVFLRAGQIAVFEHKRTERTTYLMILGQKNIKRFIQRNRYLRMRAAAIKIQAVVRGYLARLHYQRIREERAAIIIQRHVRGWLCRVAYKKMRRAAIKIQRSYRAHRANASKRHVARTLAAIKIQSVWRGYVARKAYKRELHLIVYMQSCIRRRFARRQLAALRVEARSVGKLKELNYSLETKVVGLSQQLQARVEETRTLSERCATLEASVASWKERFQRMEGLLKAKEAEAAEIAKEVAELKEANKRDKQQAAGRKPIREASIGPESVDGGSGVAMGARTLSSSSSIDGWRGRRPLVPRRGSNASAQGPDHVLDRVMTKTPDGSPVVKPSLMLDIPPGSHVTNGKQLASPARSASFAASSGPSGSSQRSMEATLIASLRAENASLKRLLASHGGVVPSAPSAPSSTPGSFDTYSQAPTSNDEIIKIMEDPDTLEEIREGLILNLQPPNVLDVDPASGPVQVQDIFFPAHVVWCLTVIMLQHDMLLHVQNFMGFIVEGSWSCWLTCLVFSYLFQDRKDTPWTIFWLANVNQLINLVTGYHQSMTPPSKSNQGPNVVGMNKAHNNASRAEVNLVRKIYNDLNDLQTLVMVSLLEKERRTVAGMTVAAVLETQELPGMRAPAPSGGGIFGAALAFLGGAGPDGSSATSSVTALQKLKQYLTKLDATLTGTFVCEEHRREVLMEMIRVVSITAFNALMTKRVFANFKRGCQIQYNVTQIEEWCVRHKVRDAGLMYMQRVMQAAKLLTLNKMTPADVDSMFELASFLNPNQIRKLLSNYPINDLDSPVCC
ncbi:P-loop containing nucleoside triphosphate hydrolase protein [Zopfochytrium polystomum]|nr:P-loop containing nucleoside triphosphate hydrolase protein [Zopfochytrium polystomum]